jgi:hypothetical protein
MEIPRCNLTKIYKWVDFIKEGYSLTPMLIQIHQQVFLNNEGNPTRRKNEPKEKFGERWLDKQGNARQK